MINKKFIIKNKKNFSLIIICLLFFLLNTLLLKNIDLGILNSFFRGYFNDLLAPIIFLSFMNILLKNILNIEIKKATYLISITLIISFIWEYIAIFLKPSSTFDYLDIIAYLIGCLIYYININNI